MLHTGRRVRTMTAVGDRLWLCDDDRTVSVWNAAVRLFVVVVVVVVVTVVCVCECVCVCVCVCPDRMLASLCHLVVYYLMFRRFAVSCVTYVCMRCSRALSPYRMVPNILVRSARTHKACSVASLCLQTAKYGRALVIKSLKSGVFPRCLFVRLLQKFDCC